MGILKPVMMDDGGGVRWPPTEDGDAEFKVRVKNLKNLYSKEQTKLDRIFRQVSDPLAYGRIGPEQLQQYRETKNELDRRIEFELQKLISDYEIRDNASLKIVAGEVLSIRFSTDPCHLFCEQTKKKLDFKKENEKATVLIRAAFQGCDVFGEWIDNLNSIVRQSLPGRKVYDTGRQINKRAQKDLMLSEDFFIVDKHNNQAKLNLKAKTFKIIQ